MTDPDEFILKMMAFDLTMRAMEDGPPLSMLVGTWAGLALGTKRPELAARVRRGIEEWVGENTDTPAEQLESEMMTLLEKVDPGGT